MMENYTNLKKVLRTIPLFLLLFIYQNNAYGQCENNLLTNGGFETGDVSSWSTTGSPSAFNTCYNQEGNFYVWLPTQGSFLWQDVPGEAGTTYNLDFFDGAHTINGQAVDLVFFDASGNEISRLEHDTSYDVDTGNCLLEANSLTGVAPAGTATIRVEVYVPASGIKIDGFCLTQSCNGSITGVYIYDQLTDAPVAAIGSLTDGQIISIDDLPDNYYIATELDGNLIAVSMELDNVGQNCENVAPYSYPNGADGGTSWNGGEGTYTVEAYAYHISGCDSEVCDSEVISFSIVANGSISGFLIKEQALINDDGDVVTASIPDANITVTLLDSNGNVVTSTTTDGNGYYEFPDVPAGDYVVSVPAAAEGCSDTSDQDESTGPNDPDGGSDPVDNEIPVTVEPGEDDEDNNFVDQYDLASISGTVTEDLDNNDTGDAPIEGVEIKIFFANGAPALNGAGIPIPNVFTDANGYYEFTELAAGDYVVMEVQPASYENVQDGDESSDGDASDGTFDTDDMIFVTVASGEDDTNNNFIEELLGTISGDVTEDVDNNDTGDQPIENVEIKLLDATGNPAVDGFGNPVANVFTDATGAYEFVDLAAGDYTVMEVQPADYVDVQDGDESDDGDATDLTYDTDDMIAVTLTAGEDDENNDFIEELLGTISGDVTEDTNNDDAGDAPIENVEIKLLDAAGNPAVDGFGNPVANVFTDATGAYEFVDLAAGDYTVMEVQPADFSDVQDGDESDDGDASDLTYDTDDMIAVTLTAGEDDENNDFIEELLGTISGDVTEDTNNDDAGDAPIENVEIKLLDAAGNPATDASGNPVTNVFTDATGAYAFIDLVAGDYTVMEVQPVDYTDVQDGDESDDGDASDLTYDTDDMIAVTLTAGEDDENNDFIEEQIGNISGHVYKMSTILNDDGDIITVQLPIENTVISLLDDLGNVLTTALTDANGFYEFLDQTAGNYVVSSPAAPDGCIDVSDEDASTGVNDPDGGNDPVDNEIPVVLEPSEDDEDNDFVDQATGNISGSVTEDTNNDDEGDNPIQGVEIILCDINGTPALDQNGNPIAPTTTDSDGYYEFTSLLPGAYTVKETQPVGYVNVLEEDTSDDDSTDLTDGNMNDNLIPIFLGSGEDDDNNDFVEEIDDPCANWIQGEANTSLSVGVVTNPGIIGSESDLVNITFVVVNTGNEPITNVVLTTDVLYFTGIPTGIVLNPAWAGDPNNNGKLDPNEIWFYSAVKSFEYNQGDSFVVTGGATGDAECGEEIGGAADLLFTSGVNMDVEVEAIIIKK